MPSRKHRPSAQRTLFPDPPTPPSTILIGGGRRGRRTILSKSAQGTDNFSVETETKAGKGWATQIAFGPHRSTLGNLPESPKKFPMATFVKRKLENGVKPIFLDSHAMRRASPPQYGTNGFADDGSNLPWVIKRLQDHHPTDFKEWLRHIQTVLSDLRDVRVIDRPEDRHAYLLLRYDTGVDVPSWMASDGTMRLMALTLLAYLPDNRRTESTPWRSRESAIHCRQPMMRRFSSPPIHQPCSRWWNHVRCCASTRMRTALRTSSEETSTRCWRTGKGRSI